jgi:hypothetical protein
VTDLDKRLEAIKEKTPKEGYNLVGVDDFEDAGDDLYLIDHFATWDEAHKELVRRKAADGSLTLYIYGPEGSTVTTP